MAYRGNRDCRSNGEETQTKRYYVAISYCFPVRPRISIFSVLKRVCTKDALRPVAFLHATDKLFMLGKIKFEARDCRINVRISPMFFDRSFFASRARLALAATGLFLVFAGLLTGLG